MELITVCTYRNECVSYILYAIEGMKVVQKLSKIYLDLYFSLIKNHAFKA